jgi:hypothetical protein
MQQPTCEICGDPTDATVCRRETRSLADHLAAVVRLDLAVEVEASVARLARHGDRGGRELRAPELDDEDLGDERRRLPVMAHGWAARLERPKRGALLSTQLPYLPGMATQAYAAINAITTTARDIAETRGIQVPMPGPMAGPLCRAGWGCKHPTCALIRARSIDHPAARAAAFLLTQLDWIRKHADAAAYVDELSTAAATLLWCVDRPPNTAYAGPCWETLADESRCGFELYAIEGAAIVECRGCGTTHVLADRRKWLRGEVQDALAIAATLAAGLSSLDMPVTSSMIRNYAARGRIVAHGHDVVGRPLYRVGDVVDVLLDQARRKAGVAA